MKLDGITTGEMKQEDIDRMVAEAEKFKEEDIFIVGENTNLFTI